MKVLDLFYLFMSGVVLLLSVHELLFAAIMPGIDRWNKRFFLVYFVILLLCCLSGLSEIIVYYAAVSSWAMYLVLFIESVLIMLPLPMLTVYLLHCAFNLNGMDMLSSRLFKAVLFIFAVSIIMLIITPFASGPFSFIYVMPDNNYYRGPLYPLLPMPVVVIMLLNLAATVKHRKRLSRKVFLSLIIAILPLTAAIFAQIFIDVFPLIDISFVLSALSMYILILSDQIDLILRNQQEIAAQRAKIMVMQMRPHFIYNTMTSIYCLCGQNPKLARQVILDFTNYLRKNFTAIASSEPIPFSSELEHTRAYLAVEQAQYKDSLFVDYDIQHVMFRVPPLTLQPIVENSVKHGRDPYAGAFHISIKTRRTNSVSEITVADDGRGLSSNFNLKQHTTLNNIQERLKIMCGGSLSIKPNDGGGTLVIVTIPDIKT